MKVPLEPLPFKLGRLDDARPRRAQLLEAGPQLRVELRVLELDPRICAGRIEELLLLSK